jgi:putative glycosyltransferase
VQLSVVTTLYRSAPYLREFCARAAAAAARVADEFEIVLVNDGSPDDALRVALELRAADPRVRVVDLSRNFGHHPAILTGLHYARGAEVFLIDCDLEEAPEWVEAFAAVRRADADADVVYGVQRVRRGGPFDRLAGAAFYKLFNLLSTEKLPPNLVTARLMSRRFVRALLRHHEVNLMLGALWVRTGFKQVAVPVDKLQKPTSSYSLGRRVALMVNAVTSFSSTPLVLVFYLGMFLVATAGLAVGWLAARWLLLGEIPVGWTSLMVSVWVFGGLTVFCQGVIGIYLSQVYKEAKRRPRAIVRRVYGRAARGRSPAGGSCRG